MYHCDGGFGGFGALVAECASGAVKCLLLIFDGEDAEDHGDVAVGVQRRYALGYRLADIVKVGCIAADDASEDDDGIVLRGLNQLRCGEG